MTEHNPTLNEAQKEELLEVIKRTKIDPKQTGTGTDLTTDEKTTTERAEQQKAQDQEQSEQPIKPVTSRAIGADGKTILAQSKSGIKRGIDYVTVQTESKSHLV